MNSTFGFTICLKPIIINFSRLTIREKISESRDTSCIHSFSPKGSHVRVRYVWIKPVITLHSSTSNVQNDTVSVWKSGKINIPDKNHQNRNPKKKERPHNSIHLQSEKLVIDLNFFSQKISSNCGFILVSELMIHKSEQILRPKPNYII